MKNAVLSIFVVGALSSAAFVAGGSANMGADPAAQEASKEMAAPLLKRVESQYVCMVTNRGYDSPQIPVAVGDKMYYGCCMGCKATLESDPLSRQSIDPVSGKTVDKASAVIGVTAELEAYYFESEENMSKFGLEK